MRCSVCGRAAVRPMQLCPGCLAAIERAEARARKLDALIAPEPGAASSTASAMLRASVAARGSHRDIFLGSSRRAAFAAAWLCTMLVFALPGNVDQALEAPAFEVTSAHDAALAPLVQAHVETRVSNRTSLTAPDRPSPQAAPAPANLVVAAASRARMHNSASASRAAAHTKLAQSPSSRPASAAKSTKVALAPTRASPVSRAPPVAPIPSPAPPQGFVESAISARSEDATAPRRTAVIALDQALEQCAEQSVFARTWCEHRARTRYCDAAGSTRSECAVALGKDSGS